MGEALDQFRDPQLDVSGDVVGFYPREFFVLGNFASFQVRYGGRDWQTSEHAYQAAHFTETSPDLVEEIFDARSAHAAYKIAKANASLAPADWDEQKVDIMYAICRAKLAQHEYVRNKLLQTKDLPIVEDSPKDDFWGWGPNQDGRNELGKIWMRLRQELRLGMVAIEDY